MKAHISKSSSTEVIYEVNLFIQREIEEGYARFLDQHIQDLLQIDGFLTARWLKAEPNENELHSHSELRWIVQYSLKSRHDLENYLKNHAARMRAQAIALFGDRFRAERRVLAEVKQYQ